MIIPSNNNKTFKFRFDIYIHKDDTPMLKYIAQRLKVGYVYTGYHFSSYIVTSKSDLQKIFSIFDKYLLNTSKNLNYLMLKKGYELYFNSENSLKIKWVKFLTLKIKWIKIELILNNPKIIV